MSSEVDVLIPFLPKDPYLDVAIESALCQSIRPNVITLNGSMGQTGVRNKLLEMSSSPWVIFLDSDDLLLPSDGIEKRLEQWDGESEAIYGDCVVGQHRRERFRFAIRKSFSDPLHALAHGASLPPTSGWMFRREAAIQPWDPQWDSGGADVYFFSQFILRGKAQYVPGIWFVYRHIHDPFNKNPKWKTQFGARRLMQVIAEGHLAERKNNG